MMESDHLRGQIELDSSKTNHMNPIDLATISWLQNQPDAIKLALQMNGLLYNGLQNMTTNQPNSTSTSTSNITQNSISHNKHANNQTNLNTNESQFNQNDNIKMENQKIIHLSPIQIENESKMSRTTKCLLALIIILVLIIILLIANDRFELKYWSYSNKQANSHQMSHSSQDLNGRLVAASTDQRYLNELNFDPDDDAPSNDSRDKHEHDDNEDSANDDLNQVPPGRSVINKKKNEHGLSRSNFNNHHYDSHHKDSYHLRQKSEQICMTPGCVRAAAQILNNMDNRTDPCNDFYRFACGGWIDTQIISDEKTSLSVFSQNTVDLNVQLRAMIEAKPSEDDPPIVGQMRNLYSSCMNVSEIEAQGDEPLLEVLRDLGGWPVLGKTNSTEMVQPTSTTSRATRSNPTSVRPIRRSLRRSGRQLASGTATNGGFTDLDSNIDDSTRVRAGSDPNGKQPSWLDTLIKFRRRGFFHDMIIDLSVVVDSRNNKRYIIDLDQSSLGLPDRSYYFKGLNDTTVAAYYKLMVESAVMLGAQRDEAQRQMKEALDFETSLAKISISREQRRNISRLYNKIYARELYTLAPNIDWKRYLTELLTLDEINMEREEVIVKVPSFLRSLDELLMNTESRIIRNYMIWRIVRHSMNGLSKKWRELQHSYSTVITGRQAETQRWESCLNSLEGTLATALSAMYVKRHFNQRSKEAAVEMVEYIKREFLRILDEVDWMDEETRHEAKLKAQGIAPYIAYPDELLQDDLVEELYSGLKISKLNYYQNLRNLRIWSTNYAFNLLKKPNKRGDWKKHSKAAVVNAYYNSFENSIEFPAGILRGAFFDAERPNYMNFGAIGYVIGHEITHGFDDRGRQFDKDGQERNWWKPKTDAKFRERAQCIVEQYGNYTVEENGLKVNGLNTQGENIADNGGLKEAYRAYKRWTKDHGKEGKLPGLDYTPDQLFWISAANIWCGKFRPEMLKLRVNSGVHSPAKFRIIGPLSNSPEFSKSFKCPIGSPMNPEKKCVVW